MFPETLRSLSSFFVLVGGLQLQVSNTFRYGNIHTLVRLINSDHLSYTQTNKKRANKKRQFRENKKLQT